MMDYRLCQSVVVVRTHPDVIDAGAGGPAASGAEPSNETLKRIIAPVRHHLKWIKLDNTATCAHVRHEYVYNLRTCSFRTKVARW